MKTIFSIHEVNEEKLASVVADMQRLGSPSIRVVDCGDYLMALEGTHRIAAAARLGIPVDLIILDQDELVAADSLDWQDLCAGEQYTAGELAGEAYSPSCGTYEVDDDGIITQA
jgi:hypothetical protein